MDTVTDGSRKRKAYTIKVKLTAIAHTIYTPCPGKKGTNNILGITLTNTKT